MLAYILVSELPKLGHLNRKELAELVGVVSMNREAVHTKENDTSEEVNTKSESSSSYICCLLSSAIRNSNP